MNIKNEAESDAEIPARFAESAFAYLDAADLLTESMIATTFPSDVPHGDVALWLAFHAAELFCKACLLTAQPGRSVNGHSLDELVKRLQRLSPPVTFQPPFDVKILPDTADSPRLRAEAHRKIHERLRYPVNTEGRPWTGVRAFLPQDFKGDLDDLRRQMDRLNAEHVKTALHAKIAQ